MAIYYEVRECLADEQELVLAEAYGAGAVGVEEQDLPGGRSRLLVYYHDPGPGRRPVDETIDWQSVSEQPWLPVTIGERLWLAPPWLDEDPPPGRLRLNYLRGQASGTGFHAATRVSLWAIERYLRPGMSFLDVGAGSGILCQAAELLDAGAIIGCDIDHPSTVIAAANAPNPFFTGSVRSIRDASFDLVVANVNATVVSLLAADLRRILVPGGWFIASGFRREETPRVELEPVERLELEGWSAVIYRRSAESRPML